ncbi:MAG: restriction endonuclease [Candidatus Kerfeldbacteria bacterium CG15_BIG_FIL_POST_REV_8_21_14_020_45_12]|uniref:Restriction endonuclease n=1 Tax=Candidatus Kerfeldbacteria bacterium CG15_BIG_FIL_POST_REV_8_21_14_020_45_12 TaxID=2014247 RepID=A0A2M7H5A2_9BACT|nr:MAG: restriction endonuclease [Candidatus Kerfeldbacteria bacterium CG15_BIG_FIL_POST_REV_8_21_14_020_45_12]PJA93711.1 MAG: restriction endonuclease [Candidatus Kerfeldbacteria bacterium CG_4_9_14_3_um_filter_45_8]
MSSPTKTIQLGEIGKVSMCKRVLKHETSSTGDIPFYKISTFGEKANAYIPSEIYEKYRAKYSYPKKGDILISAAGTVGKTVIYDGSPAYYQDSNIVWIENDETEVLNSYLYYFYQTRPWVTTEGSTIKRLYNDDLRNLEIRYPADIIDQKSIANTLATLDAKIELNNKINAELEQMAKMLYDYWFVQFDFPDENGEPYKSSGGEMVWNDGLKREIPAGWKIGTVENLGTVVGGSTPSTKKTENFCESGIPWITPKDLSMQTGLKYISKGSRDITEKGLKDASLKIHPTGTVLLSSRAPVGYMAIARNDVTTNQGFKSVVPNKGYSKEFVYYAIKNALPAIIQYSSGSTFSEISGSVLKTVKLAIPPQAISSQYTELVQSLFKRQDVLEQENQELAELRDWLLPMLMNGQVVIE